MEIRQYCVNGTLNQRYDLLTKILLENTLETSVRVDSLIEFFEADGHNLVAFGDLDARRHLRNLALNFGIDFQPFVSLL